MKRILKWTVAGIALLFVAAQFVWPARGTNPALDPTRTIEARVHLPAEVDALLERSCMDCHSHQTRWPWYSRVAPASWFVTDHVTHGRKHLNFSEWARYDRDDTDFLLHHICQTAKSGTMPLASYLRLHPEARLSDEEIRMLCDWTSTTRRHLAYRFPGEQAPP